MSNMKIIGVYKIVNILNSKQYIGSSNDVKFRISTHKSRLKKGNHHSIKLQRAYNKYGLESFIFELIEICDIDDLLIREQHYINLFDSYNNGYNSTLIAGSPMLGKTQSIEAKNKISDFAKTRTGDKNHMFNKNHTTETKKLMSKNKMNTGIKRVSQLDNNNNPIKTWDSLSECAKELKLHISGISKVLNGEIKTTKGYKFKYQ